MRVLVNALNLRPGVADGAATFALNVLRGLAEVRPTWHLTVIAGAGETRVAEAVPSATVISLRVGQGARRALVETLLLARLARRVQPDVYVAPYESLPIFLRKPVVVIAQNLVYHHGIAAQTFRLRLRYWYYRNRMPRAYRRAARVVAVSEYVARVLAQSAGLEPEKTVVSLGGADSIFLPAPVPNQYREPMLLVVGAVAPHKDVEGTLRLFERLHRARPDLRLVFVGPETAGYAKLLANYASTLGLSDAVSYLGPRSPTEVAALYSTSTALIHLSRVEAFPLPPLESMRYGLPVVVANRSSLPEVVGDAGLVIDPEDPESAALVAALLASRERLDDLRARGLRRASELTWARAAEQLAVAIEQSAG